MDRIYNNYLFLSTKKELRLKILVLFSLLMSNILSHFHKCIESNGC